MQQVLNPAVTEYDYLELDVLLQCIELPYIRHNIVPSAEYEQDPKKNAYWERDYFKATSAANGVLASNESTAFLLTRDLPRPTFGFENDFSSAIGLIKWRNTPGRKTATVWLDIFAHSHRYSSEFLHCCTNVFKMFMSTYKIHRWERVWLSAETNKEKSNQVMLALEGVDFLLRRDIDRFLHGDLTTFICRNMQHSSHRWPCISPCPDDLYKRLAKIRDPCLAIIGGYAFDAPVSVEETLSSDYTREYFYSLKRAYSLLYYNLSWIDKPDTWALRAAVWHSSPETVMMCEEALRKPETMQRTYSCWDSGFRGEFVPRAYINFNKCEVNPILALISLLDTQDSPYFVFPERVNQDSINQIWEMCKVIKTQPSELFNLLIEIASWETSHVCTPKVVACFSQSAEQGLFNLDDECDTEILHLLAGSLQTLRFEMMKDSRGSPEERETIAGDLDRIGKLLQTRCHARTIGSLTHTRLLSCARGGAIGQPATGWLEMYHIQ
ncbi:hypothetical protein M408DRAFT_305923 [Serendipita vermifera MAFF 305830]|uniref:Uncharacterized protein n=1 Tax=Serendipita vermifera MAFF 305830 TaxID=933852 RepID=A0A0C3ALI0_SERVB|nr:hypothetical protein M408DRAFT_305923 [Serendipita vermifera MAFF 305830]